MDLKKDLLLSVETGLIEKNIISDKDLRPQLLINDYQKSIKLLNSIEDNLRECDSFIFSIAFFTKSGLLVMKNILLELAKRNIRGQILTSDYLYFNEPDALRELIKFNNLDVKIYTKDAFHIKGYIFEKSNYTTMIIGSSNLTQDALLKNKEWNMMVTSLDNGALVQDILDDFNMIWNDSIKLDEDYIREYEKKYRTIKHYNIEKEYFQSKEIVPTLMQEKALLKLMKLRSKGENKGLVISATGTGKTYLSAFDVKALSPNKVLFVVHRTNIAKQAMNAYKNVIKNKSIGLLFGSQKDLDKDLVFSTIQTLSKDEILNYYEPDYFDYIIIDEVHRSGAKSYLKVLDHFNPKFLLGMTATPERTDGYDIYSLFDNNIAFEIRLNDALEDDILSPFHYFGIADIISESYLVDENTDFNMLTSDERVNKIIDTINLYGYSGKKPKGLIFCSRVREAHLLSKMFNDRGYKTVSIDGKTNETDREKYMDLLESDHENDYLDFIFSVDVFNEGIDIQSINMIVMLRPTQSAIIFVQQLGRGLRKYPGKEYLVVLDFIGNYSNNYMIPIALYGDRTYNKDNLRRFIQEGNASIPGSTTIHFDEIAKERIFAAINTAPFRHLRLLRDEYIKLKNKIKRVPMMFDFYEHGYINPFKFIDYSGSYYDFLVKYYDYKEVIGKEYLSLLRFVSKELLFTKRLLDIYVLTQLCEKESIRIDELIDDLRNRWQIMIDTEDILSTVNTINGRFLNGIEKYNLKDYLIDFKNNEITITDYFKAFLSNDNSNVFVCDAIHFAYDFFIDEYYRPKDYRNGFYLYKKYSRKDVARILKWEKDYSSTMYGYMLRNNSLPIFVTYHKNDKISSSTQYEDYFISRNIFNWMSKNNRNLDSKEIVAIRGQEHSGLHIPLFIKKSDDEGSDFYFIGNLRFDAKEMKMEETFIENDKGKKLPIVNITFAIEDTVKKDLYRYFVKD
jgi:superfamily II DNA or RNA helicase